MIWGKTTEQKDREREEANLSWFAWRPVILYDGRWVWWQCIRRVIQYTIDGIVYTYYISPLENKKEKIKYPICPINLYWEGDENVCDTDKCNFEDRTCSQACKRSKE